jgi:tetratricopeptide (TPR) repeat protein
MKKTFLFSICISISVSSLSQVSFTDLVGNTEKAVVSITTKDKLGNSLMTGTGFFIDRNGTVLSNLHIFENANSATISTFNNDKFEIDTILISSKEYDIIKFSIQNPKGIKFNYLEFKTQNPQKGEDIFTIGNPMGLESTVSKGIISNIRDIENLGSLYQITAPISAGSSGSPVMNMKGEVIGIATFQLTSGQNLNFAIDVDFVNRINQNDAIFSEINAKKILPPKQEIAWQTLDSMWMTKEILPYLNEYIRKYPNDYRGFLKRAYLFSGPGYGAHTLIEDKYRTIYYDPETRQSKINLDEDGEPVTDSMYNIGISKVYQRSIPDYNRALELKPNEPLVYYQKGLSKLFYCQSNSNKIPGWTFQSAIDDLLKSEGLKDPKLQQDRLYYLGLAHLELSQYKTALNAFNQAIKVKEVPYDSYYNPHIIYYEIAKIKCDQLKDTLGAIIDLNKAIELTKSISTYQGEDQAPSSYLAKRAEIEYAQKKYSEALEDLRKVNKSIFLSDDGHSSYTHYLESFILLKIDGDLYEALSAIDQAIINDKNVSTFHKTRSRVNIRLKDYPSALKDLNKALELDPSDFNDLDYSERSRIKGLLNDNIGAIKDIDKAIELNNKDSYYYNLKAIYLSQLGDDIGAEKQYDKAIELDPKNSDYYISRGWSKLRNKKTDACADWSKAGELGNYEAYDLIQKYCK